MTWLTTALLFLLGAAWGSFLFVFSWRLPKGEDFISGRSKCAKCHKKLTWWELIPIISYVALMGRCKSCKKAISWVYFAIEIVVGLLFVTGYQMFGVSVEYALFLFEISALIVIFLIDLYTTWVYEMIVLPTIGIVLATQLIFGIDPLLYIIGGLAGAGVFWVQYAFSRGKWVGKGDIRIGALIGVILGWKVLFVALVTGYIFGATAAVILILSKKKKRSDMIPFGPFLVTGTIIGILWGQQILDCYIALVGF